LFAGLGPSPAEAQLVIIGTHTIEVEEGETETINGPVSGNASAILNLHGPGLVKLSSNDSPNFLGTVFIRGSEFRILNGAGMVRSSFYISNGGTLSFDRGNEIIGNDKTATLNAGNINLITNYDFGNDVENVGILNLNGGANTIDIRNDSSLFYIGFGVASSFSRIGPATLNLTSNHIFIFKNASVYFHYTSTSPSYLVGGIIPWLTIDSRDWATSSIGEPSHFDSSRVVYRYSFTSSEVGPESTWGLEYNISLNDNQTLTGNRTINSLRLPAATSVLNLGGYSLTLNSGGILAVTGNSQINGSGTITTASGVTLYIHSYGDTLTLEEKAAFSGGRHLVKTGPAALELDSEATHEVGGVWIHQGVIRLLKGIFGVSDEIIIGDGAGIDSFEIAANLDNPIVKTSGGFPEITLHGNPYGPLTDAAVLRFNGNTRQQLAKLHILDRGMIDFIGNNKAAPNILYLDQLTFSDTNARLTIRNWNGQADYLLVRKIWGDANISAILNRIYFEGYGPARWEPHSLQGYGDHWQITPFPEPATYGAILGAIGLGLWGWKKRRRATTPV